MLDNERTLSILHAIRNLGVQISMDDFGTGYSSLSYLQSFPFSKIKVDRAFVSRLGAADQTRVIIRSIIEIARSLGMKTTAEGVETIGQHECLVDLQCDEAQGYLYSRPVPADSLPELLSSWQAPARFAA
jgi:EAL domain-containing protein (putative c-di-GMP-specific phosphodiesterase class I)